MNAIDFSPDGKQILAGCDDGKLRLLDAAIGAEITAYGGHRGDRDSRGVHPRRQGGVALRGRLSPQDFPAARFGEGRSDRWEDAVWAVSAGSRLSGAKSGG